MINNPNEKEINEWLKTESLWWMLANISFRSITMKQIKEG
jgi:hypothetical protein